MEDFMSGAIQMNASSWVYVASLFFSGAYVVINVIQKISPLLAELVEKVKSYTGLVGVYLMVFSAYNLYHALQATHIVFEPMPIVGGALISAYGMGFVLGLFEFISSLKTWKSVNTSIIHKIESKTIYITRIAGVSCLLLSLFLVAATYLHWKF